MKTKKRLTLAFVCCSILSGCVPLGYAEQAKITVHVVDEDGAPVAGATIKGQFSNHLPAGASAGGGIPTYVDGITGANGLCVLSGRCNEPSVGFAVLKGGYYDDGGGLGFTNTSLGHWQPWNSTVEVVLKKIGIQVPMYARRVMDSKIPLEGKPCGFDLMVGDWVAPYGKGKTADAYFNLTRKSGDIVHIGPYSREYKLYDDMLTVSFPNDGDGIQQVLAFGYSELHLPRQAPTNGYSQTLIKHQYETATNTIPQVVRHSDYRPDANYFFRVRSKKDEKGNIVSTCYGKIYDDFNRIHGGDLDGGALSFTYYLNPEPNSRNMEFNTSSNLFKNLSPVERVTAP